nr:hypothetical protein [Neobacillus sp. Marseille-Q6967]
MLAGFLWLADIFLVSADLTLTPADFLKMLANISLSGGYLPSFGGFPENVGEYFSGWRISS